MFFQTLKISRFNFDYFRLGNDDTWRSFRLLTNSIFIILILMLLDQELDKDEPANLLRDTALISIILNQESVKHEHFSN